jgi:hypothetical protein
MLKNYCKIIAVVTVFSLATGAEAARHIMVSQEGNVYKVYDPKDKTTVWVKDVRAYIKYKYRDSKVDGFGGKLSNKSFRDGSTPVADAAEAASDTVNSATGVAYNVANRVPSWRRYTAPLRALFGTPDQNQR